MEFFMVRVSDVMTRSVVCIEQEDTLQEAIDLMELRGCRHLVVVEGDRVCGILSDRDCRLAQYSPYILRERWQDETVLNETHVGAMMTTELIHVAPSHTLAQAAQTMLDNQINALVVLEGGDLVGIVTSADVMCVYIDEHRVDID
jgi:acetoin utilization protein AcuB